MRYNPYRNKYIKLCQTIDIVLGLFYSLNIYWESMHKKDLQSCFTRFRLFFFLMFFVVNLSVNAQEKPTPPVPTPVLTAEQMESAIVVSDMRATNRVMAGPNETVVYRLADCDTRDENAPCYVVVSASIVENSLDETFSKRLESNTKILSNFVNRSMVLQCSISTFSNTGSELARLVQRTGVTFHTTADKTPLTLNWANTNDTWSGQFFNWLSISGPNADSAWGSYVPMQTRIATTAVGQVGFYLINVWIGGGTVHVGVALHIHTSGWGCS